MLVLLFELGIHRYAIDASQVIEVLPLVELRRRPQSPAGVAGLFDFRGSPVSVFDLAQVLLGRPAQSHLSTRVVVVRSEGRGDGSPIGLIAERVTEMARRDAREFVWPGATEDQARCLGPIAPDEHGLLQLIDVRRLLSAAVRTAPFPPHADAPWPLPTSNA